MVAISMWAVPVDTRTLPNDVAGPVLRIPNVLDYVWRHTKKQPLYDDVDDSLQQEFK